MRIKLFIAILCSLCSSVFFAQAQTGSRPLTLDLSKTNSVTPTNAPAKPPLKEISPGVFELGIVRLNKDAKTVSFPAVVNMREDIVEYWIVHKGGKIHESVLTSEAEPYHIHLAMLLIGAKGRPNLTPAQRVEDKTTAGDTIALWFEYQDEKGGQVKKRAEETIQDKSTKATMAKGDWTYNGSWIFNGAFVAQRELSIVSNIHDHDALINNPRPLRENDENWLAETKNLPPNGTPVTVTIELLKPYVKPDTHETKP